MVDRLTDFGLGRWIGIFVLIIGSVAVATQRPDPDLVAALEAQPRQIIEAQTRHTTKARTTTTRKIASNESASEGATTNSSAGAVDLTYPEGALAPEHARPLSKEATLAYSYRPAYHEKNFSFVIPSVVVHGFPIDKEVADQMPRKLDDGQTVVTPGAGLEYVSPGGFLLIGGVLKDCYNDLAGLLQVGQQFRLASHTTFGYSVGIYARETPIECTTTVNRLGRATTTCDEFDNYNLKWMTQVNGESVDIIPMPFLHFTTALYHGDEFELDLKIMSNFALNEFGFSVPF